MKTRRHQRPRLSDQSGAAAIAAAMALSAALAIGVYVTNDQLANVAVFEHRQSVAEQMNALNLDAIENVAQMMQVGSVVIDPAMGMFEADGQALKPVGSGGLGWTLGAIRDEIALTYCNPRTIDGNVEALLGANRVTMPCDAKDKVTTKSKITGIQTIENIMPDGTKEEISYAVLEVSTVAKVRNDFVTRKKKARVKIPPPGSGECPYIDPERNPPKTAAPFDAPLYIATGRAFAGWARIGINANKPQANGYASVQFEGELTSDLQCGSHACSYWAPSTATETIRAWKVKIGGLLFGVQLHVPNESPGSCYLTFHPNRRPTSSWNNGCFAAGTQIRMADKSLKPVERIEQGDLVYNPVTRSPARVTRTVAGPEAEPLLEVATGKSSVIVTTKHPFLTNTGLKAAKDLSAGDRIMIHGGRYAAVERVTALASEPAFVYNFAVASTQGSDFADHMVEADGVVTGDLYLQEQVSGIDPTKRPVTPEVGPYKDLLTRLLFDSAATR